MCQENQFWSELKSGKFASLVKDSARGEKLSNAAEVYHVMRPMFAEQDDVEVVYGIFLDTKNRVLSIEKLATGSIASAAIYPREIVKRAIGLKTAALVLVHNHPSGDPEPSREDFTITAKALIALDSVGVAVHDHIVVGDGFHSMADSGWLETMREKISNLTAS